MLGAKDHAADEGAHDTDDDIGHHARAATADQLRGEPAGDQTDETPNDYDFQRHDLYRCMSRASTRPVGCRLTFTDSLVLFRIGRRARALALTPVRNRKLQLHALQSPGLCEALAATLFDDVGMPHDETLGRSLQHGVDGARDRGLIPNLLSDVGRYAQTLVAAGDARGTTPGPVVTGTSTKDDVCAQQGLRRSMIEHLSLIHISEPTRLL